MFNLIDLFSGIGGLAQGFKETKKQLKSTKYEKGEYKPKFKYKKDSIKDKLKSIKKEIKTKK